MLGGVAEDSELEVVVGVVEEIELAVTARAFVDAPLVVVAADVGEVLILERAGDAVEEFEGVGGGLVAERIGTKCNTIIAAAPRRRARGARRRRCARLWRRRR